MPRKSEPKPENTGTQEPKKSRSFNKVASDQSKVPKNAGNDSQNVKSAGNGGRPSDYSHTIADEIIDRMSDGESLRSICASDNMPRRPAIYRWLDAHEEFRNQYARACEAREAEIFDQIIEIADTPQLGTKSVSKATGIEITKADMIEHRRLQVEARKWALAKMAPKKYGDKLAIGGAEGLPPVQSSLDVGVLPTEVLAEIMKARDAAK